MHTMLVIWCFLVGLACPACGLTIYGGPASYTTGRPNNPGPYLFNLQSYPVTLEIAQGSGMVMWDNFNTNLTFALAPTCYYCGCDFSPYKGFFFPFASTQNVYCTTSALLKEATLAGVTGIAVVAQQQIVLGGFANGVFDEPYIPLFGFGDPTQPYSYSINDQWYPGKKLTTAKTSGFNVSVLLTLPTPNILSDMIHAPYRYWPSNLVFIWWVNALIALSLIGVAAGKIWVFVLVEGWNISLVKLQSALAIACAMFAFTLCCFCGYSSMRLPGHYSLYVTIVQWPWAISLTQCILIGFYFMDLSLMTTANTGQVLFSTMRVPLLVVIFVCWTMVIVCSGMLGTRIWGTTGTTATQGILSTQFATMLIFTSVAIIAQILGVVFLGSNMRNMSDSGRSTVLKVLGICICLCVIIGCISYWFWIWRFYSTTLGFAEKATEYQTLVIYETAGMGVVPMAVSLICILLFRVKVAKEIELSKSATSSTASSSSSVSKSSSSGSSSSASQEPVIEL